MARVAPAPRLDVRVRGGRREDTRPEALERARVEKEREVEVISVDKDYKPKVSTWGVYPRPKNISETYGGGRTIRPGQKLESEEETDRRKKRVVEAVQQYKRQAGIEVGWEEQQTCDNLLKKGKMSMDAGRLMDAISLYQKVLDIVPMQSMPGGKAAIQKAICLDSLGKQDDARELYQQLLKHRCYDTRKQADRMLWGMVKATKFLKADNFSYGVGNSAYKKYFDRLSGSWNTMYVVNNQEEEDDGLMAQVVSIFALLAGSPVLLLYILRTLH